MSTPSSIELSVVIPCLNEERTIQNCVQAAKQFLESNHIRGEVIVADNGSDDRSTSLAEAAGAQVVKVEEKGYGSAIMGGILQAQGDFIIFGDADESYDFLKLEGFLAELRGGADMIIGSRFLGTMEPDAMPFLHRYLGTPVLTVIHRVLFGSRLTDSQSGLRGIRRSVVDKLDLRTRGMEFASEMLVKATLLNLNVREIPIDFRKDKRNRPPHLRTWRDGWRHLRFLLLYSPRWLFVYPGVSLIASGSLVLFWLLPGPRHITSSIGLDVHTMLAAGTCVILGYQLVLFGIFARVFAEIEQLIPKRSSIMKIFEVLTLERGILLGLLSVVLGIIPLAVALKNWADSDFGPQDYTAGMRLLIPAVTAIILGVQTVFGSFLLSLLGLNRK
jgi:glycosyltransferase involved in cell wall biosynthesis